MTLLPCPFCGGSNTQIKKNEAWMGGLRPSQLLSVEVRHWCEQWDKLSSRCISLIGETEDSAVKRWNTRYTPKVEVHLYEMT